MHRGGGDGFEVARTGLVVGSQPRNNVRFADVDGDGALDIVAPAMRRAGVTILLGDGAGGFRAAPDSPVSTAEAPFFVAFPDFDGDGLREILAAHRGGSWADNRHDDVTLLKTQPLGSARARRRLQDTCRPVAVADRGLRSRRQRQR